MKKNYLPAKMATQALIVMLSVLLFAGVARADQTNTTQQSVSDDQVADLIDHYETFETFTGTHELPADLSEGLDLGAVHVNLGASTAIEHDGYSDYGDVNGHRIIAASDGENRDRFALIIDDAEQSQFVYDVDLPEGSTVTNLADGRVIIDTPNSADTALAPSLAVDANGTQLASSYNIINGQLIIDVDLQDAEFPVMVDPSATWRYWWGTATYYSRGYVKYFGSWYAAVNVAKWVCNFTGGWAKWVCKRTIGRYTGWIANGWASAKRNNQCMQMNMTWTGQVTKVRPYWCRWY